MRNTTAQTPGTATAVAEKPGLKGRAIEEGKKFLIMTLYLWVFFAVLNLHRTIVLQNEGIDYQEQGFAIINALVIAKVMLIADDLKLGARFKGHRLIYGVLWYSLVFTIVLICFHIAEHAILALVRGSPVRDSLADFGAGKVRGVLSVGAIVFVGLVPFFAFRGIARLLGDDQLWLLLYARGQKRFALVEQE